MATTRVMMPTERPHATPPPSFTMDSFLSAWHGSPATQLELQSMLLDRGFQPSTERRTVDRRRTSDLKPLLIRRAESRPRTPEPALHLSRKGSASASHLQRQKTALPTLFGDEESRAPDPAKVDQRMRQKLHRLQQETGRRAHELRQRSNAQGIFDDRVNKVRATSTCLSDLRRSTSFVEMRTQVRPPTLSLLVHDQPLPPLATGQASDEVLHGVPFEPLTKSLTHGAATLQAKLDTLLLERAESVPILGSKQGRDRMESRRLARTQLI